MKVGLDILDYRLLRMIKRVPRQDLAVMLTVFTMTVFVDLIVAVGGGVTLASLMITYRISSQSQIDVKGGLIRSGIETWKKALKKRQSTEYEHSL